MKKQVLYLLVVAFLIIYGCKKEFSFEQGNTPSAGSLQSGVPGDCLPKTVNGIYEVGTPLVSGTNTLSVDVNVVTTGNYIITTDTVNGFYFRAAGTFTASGLSTVTLQGNGTPFAAGSFNYVVSYDSTICDIQVTVLPAGAGGPAVFTLTGAPNVCTGALISGTYSANTALTSTNTVSISVNVTTIGAYNISTNFQGMTFGASGAFTATGVQQVILNGSGTPTTIGVNTVPVTVGSSICSFDITVQPGTGGQAVFTLTGAPNTCTGAVINGTYAVGTPLTVTNTVRISVDVTTVGNYNISTSFQGMTFSATGTFAATGAQLVTLNGSGTPTTSGTNTIPVTVGTTTCSFDIPVQGPAVGTLGGGPGACTPSTINGTYTVGTALTATNTVQIQINATSPGSYTISSNTVTGFSFSGSGTATSGTQNITLNGTGTPTTAGPQVFTVTFGTSTCTFTVNCQPSTPLSNDYFPRTTNSNWTYEFDDDQTDTLFRTVIAQTLSANSNTYNIFLSNDGTGLDSSGYFRKTASPGNYYQWFDVGYFFGYDNPLWVEYIMLKDDVPAGTNWKSSGFAGTFSTTPFNLRFSYTILQKDVPITISASTGSTLYQNVIVVEEKIEVEVAPGVWQDATTSLDFYSKSYYARGIGLIQYEELDATNAVTFKTELRRSQVY